jgi:radical SAM superfamily enzyme YgiQ (UPF0313 family)
MRPRVAFIQLPLFTKDFLSCEEIRFYNTYWKRFSHLVEKNLDCIRFSYSRNNAAKIQPAYDIYELPLWIAVLGGVLKEIAKEVLVIDLFDLTAPRPDQNEIKRRITDVKADIFLLSPLTSNFPLCQEVASYIKAAHGPNVYILVGGPFATYEDISILSVPEIDVVFRGRVGKNILAVCQLLVNNSLDELEKVSGITFRKNSGIYRTAIYSQNKILMSPEYALIPQIYAKRIPWARIYCSDGCPWKCAYCADVIWNRSQPHYRDLSDVMADVDNIVTRFGVDLFYVGDETFTFDSEFVMRFSDQMRSRGLKWICQTRVDCVDPYLLQKMQRGNCKVVKFGAESGVQHLLDIVRKNIRVEQIPEACSMAHDAGLGAFTYWLIGMPGESKQTALQTISFIENLISNSVTDLIEWFICVPYPGTDLYANPKRYGIQVHKKPWQQWREDTPSVLETKRLLPDEIYHLWLDGLDRFDKKISEKCKLC